jgi:hypothetical protein
MKTTNELTNKITDYINAHDGCAVRINSASVYDPVLKIYRKRRKSDKGVADILACWQGMYIAIEIKIGKDKQNEDQKTYEERVLHAGGLYILIKTWEDFLFHWNTLTVYEEVA